MMQIKQFNDWLVESKQEESAKFIAGMEQALKKKGLSYKNESSNAQLKNGTLVIKLIDNPDLLTDVLKERGIKNTDFISDSARVKYYGCKVVYTLYSRGAVRVFSGSSDSLKFDTSDLDKVADWLENHYKITALSMIKTDLKPESFIKTNSKSKPYSEEEISKVFTAEAIKDYDRIKQFPASTPEIVFAVFLARVFNTKVKNNSLVNRNLEYTSIGAYLAIKIPDSTISLTMRPEWKIGTKNPTVEVKLTAEWNSRTDEGRSYSGSLKDMAKNDIIPERFLDIYAKIKKGDYDIESFIEKAKYSISGKKFGI